MGVVVVRERERRLLLFCFRACEPRGDVQQGTTTAQRSPTVRPAPPPSTIGDSLNLVNRSEIIYHSICFGNILLGLQIHIVGVCTVSGCIHGPQR